MNQSIENPVNGLLVGIHPGIPSEKYHALAGASNSRLCDMMNFSPAHMHHKMMNPEDPTPALIFGDACHLIVLQGEAEFRKRYVVPPSKCTAITGKQKPCSNPAKHIVDGEWFCGVHADESNDPRRSFSQDDYDACRKMRDNVLDHPAAGAILAASPDDQRELSVIWKCVDTGVLCKGRMDAPAPTLSTIADLKTTLFGGGSRRKAMRTINDRGYHFQADMYLGAMQAHGKTFDHFVDIFVEKEPPHAVCVYRIEDEVLEKAHEVHIRRMKLWKQCEESGVWPGYEDAVQSIRISDFAMREMQEI